MICRRSRTSCGATTRSSTPASASPPANGRKAWSATSVRRCCCSLARSVLVLLIACANLANLLIARATVRERELQTRALLGADRARLIREVLTEIVMLVAAGGTAGVAVAVGLIRALTRIGPIGLPRLNKVTVDGAVMGFSVALMLLTTLLFGLWPSRHAARASATATIGAAARTIAGGRLRHRSRRALIVAEVSLSLVLLIGATLLIMSLRRLQHVEAGFNADRLLTTMVIRYRPDRRDAFVQQLVDRISSLSGVHSAAATSSLPLSPGGWSKLLHRRRQASARLDRGSANR